MNARFSHLPGYELTARACRVMSRAVLQDEETDALYKLVLELTPQVQPLPGSGLPPASYPACTALGVTVLADGTYPALLASAPTSRADGLVVYWRSGLAPFPTQYPTPSYAGDWHFGVYNAGSIDQAGFNVGNHLYVYATGPGTITVHTAPVAGPSTLSYQLRGWDGSTLGYTTTISSAGGITPGSDITVTVPDDGACYHLLDIIDSASGGGGWGFSGYTWANA